jgi:hypothetical protein
MTSAPGIDALHIPNFGQFGHIMLAKYGAIRIVLIS